VQISRQSLEPKEAAVAHANSLSLADPVVRRTAHLLELIFPSPRRFGIRLWDGRELPMNSLPRFSLVLNHPGALRRMFKPPVELSLGEAFIRGDFEIEGDIFAAFPLLESIAARRWSVAEMADLALSVMALPATGPEVHGRGPMHARGAVHSRERDRQVVQYHYDVGNEFYALWLDRDLQYSCAYFPTGSESLDSAQELKMEHICRKLCLQPGERLLDIGCGWAGLARFAAAHHGVQVLGVTLSKNQKAYADEQIQREGLRGRVTVELTDYRDLGRETFDKIVSVGMFEHVGRSHLPLYFAEAYRLLKPGGLFLNHGISRRAADDPASDGVVARLLVGQGSFSQRYIFPDGELVPVSEAAELAEAAGFEVRDVENLREHYALTLRHWVRRLADHRAEAIKVAAEVTYRTWRLYMSASAYSFESGHLNVNQTLLAKMTSEGKSRVPLSRADLYQ
jgi:cyclopropane-fatty-acyl-phospholipid synthase